VGLHKSQNTPRVTVGKASTSANILWGTGGQSLSVTDAVCHSTVCGKEYAATMRVASLSLLSATPN
jgi:hypothetical protein